MGLLLYTVFTWGLLSVVSADTPEFQVSPMVKDGVPNEPAVDTPTPPVEVDEIQSGEGHLKVSEQESDKTKSDATDRAPTFSSSLAKARAIHGRPPWSRFLTPIVEYFYYGASGRSYIDNSDDEDKPEDDKLLDDDTNSDPPPHQHIRVNCSIKEQNSSQVGSSGVILVNDSSLQQLLMSEKSSLNQTSQPPAAECQTLLLFAPWCAFSAQLASHYNALHRLFPDLKVLAINAVTLNYWNARFGTVAVPNVLLLHNGNFIARYNYTEQSIEGLTWFIQNFTNLNASQEVKVIDEDYAGPVPTQQVLQTDVYLLLSWSVILFALVYACHIYKDPAFAFYHRIVNLFNYDHNHLD